jgi:hypothetical protein
MTETIWLSYIACAKIPFHSKQKITDVVLKSSRRKHAYIPNIAMVIGYNLSSSIKTGSVMRSETNIFFFLA